MRLTKRCSEPGGAPRLQLWRPARRVNRLDRGTRWMQGKDISLDLSQGFARIILPYKQGVTKHEQPKQSR
jgi:hypothetical protein